jgi:hypothetical protein
VAARAGGYRRAVGRHPDAGFRPAAGTRAPLGDVDATAKAGRAQLATGARRRWPRNRPRSACWKPGLAETQSQAVALEAMYQELSSTRDERLLAEVEQAVVIAMQQLQFAGNVEAALIALQGAEARLARSVQPQFLPVTQADRARHRAAQGHSRRQHQWPLAQDRKRGAAVDGLPLAYEQRPVASRSGRPTAQAGQRGLLARAGRRPVARVPPAGAHRAHRTGRSGAAGAATRAISCAKTSSCACSTRASRCCNATAEYSARKSASRASSSNAISTIAPSRCRRRSRP